MRLAKDLFGALPPTPLQALRPLRIQALEPVALILFHLNKPNLVRHSEKPSLHWLLAMAPSRSFLVGLDRFFRIFLGAFLRAALD